jgi:hypothetical protein
LACCGICVPSNAEHAASRFRGMRRAKGSHTQYWLGVAGLQPAFGGAVLGRKLGRRDNATAREHMMAGRVQLRHGRAATPPAVAARSSKMPKSSAPEFRIKDGSRLHSGECAQSLDVLIPARRRGTRSRTHAHRPSCRRRRLCRTGIRSPGPKTRAAIWSTAAWQSRKRSTPKVFADLIRDHVLSTVSPGSTRPGFGLIQRDNSRVGHWNSSTSMANISSNCFTTFHGEYHGVDDPDPCRDLHRPRDQRLPARRVLIRNSALRDARQKAVIVLVAATGGLPQRRPVHDDP